VAWPTSLPVAWPAALVDDGTGGWGAALRQLYEEREGVLQAARQQVAASLGASGH
jgi:hypothetical protein